jgi:inner membrane protein
MATPVGHYLLGLSVMQLFARDRDERRRSIWLATVACVPDLDVIPGIFVGNLGRFHHGISHSFFAAAVFSLIAFGILWRQGWKPSESLLLLLFLLYASHVVLDFFTLDPGAPHGVPLLWPWRETYQSSWALLPNVQHTGGPLFSAHNFFLMVREAVLFLPLIGFIYALKDSGWRSPNPVAWFFAAWFIVAVSASFLSLNVR